MGSAPASRSTSEFSRRAHLDDTGVDAEASGRLGQPVVVREHDDLAVLRDFLEDARKAVDAARVHRLHGVVDDDEAERALGQRRAGQEQAQRHRVELALAHHAERGALHAVDANIELHVAAGTRAREQDALEFDTALLAKQLPQFDRLARRWARSVRRESRRSFP